MGGIFMNSLKQILLISTALVSQQCIAQICVNNSSNYKMFGSVLRAGALARGHELAFKDNNFTDHQQFSAESDADLAKQIENMSSGSCSVILGLFTSRECLIAGPVLKKNKLIGVSSSCGHDNIKKFSPYLYTLTPSVADFSDKISSYLNESKDRGKIYALYQPTDIYSETGFIDFKKKYTKQIIEILVESDGRFDRNRFSNPRNEKFTIVFFTYPLPSAKILMELSEQQLISKNTTIIGASSWTFDVSVFRPLRSILEKANDVLTADALDWNKVKNSKFVKSFSNKFNREPLTIEILTYDVTHLSINCYKSSLVNNKYDINKFKNCMTNKTYQGVSGPFAFSKDSPFAKRPIFLTHFLERM
jgi:ABC-type branched-subunit amino acid transport system substrate-binding protein